MKSNIIETKMSDLQVVQTVLDFWDPYSASIFNSSTLSQIDEYDSYSFPILELLRDGPNHDLLFHFLKNTELDKGRLSRDENEARNRFFAWSFLQTWQRHQDRETNIRRLHVDSVQWPDGDYRFMPRLELIQQYLQQWDPLETSKFWLCGADTLNRYDEASLLLDQAILSKDIDEVCLALEFACITEADGMAFTMQNHSKREDMQKRCYSFLGARSQRHKDRAGLLIEIFRHPNRSVQRRIRPRIESK